MKLDVRLNVDWSGQICCLFMCVCVSDRNEGLSLASSGLAAL